MVNKCEENPDLPECTGNNYNTPTIPSTSNETSVTVDSEPVITTDSYEEINSQTDANEMDVLENEEDNNTILSENEFDAVDVNVDDSNEQVVVESDDETMI